MPDEIIGGVNEQGVTAPAEVSDATTGNGGADMQEVADPGGTDGAEEMGGEGSAAEHDGGAEETSKPWKNEKNAQFAAARRKAERERDIEVERLRADYARREQELIAGMGITNPETGAPIRTREEYNAAVESMRKTKTAELARRAGMAEEEFSRLVEMSPAVREANEMKRQAQLAEQAARTERIKQELREEVAEIAKLDPSIKSVEDLRAAENWPQIEEKLRRGYGLLDAYRLINMDAIGERRAQAARQQAMNAATQKQHMQRSEQQGVGSVTVPNHVREMYRRLNPKATDAEIERHYAKYEKNKK